MAVGSLSTPSPGIPEVGGDAGRRTLTTFARSMSAHADVVQPADDASWAQLLARAGGRGITVRGAGASYSDAPLNSGGTVARTGGGGAAVRSWNEAAALVEVDAGMSLAELCAHTVPRGLLPPVLPGTAHVTVGGAIAGDIHGKNHARRGSFTGHVAGLRLLTPAAGTIHVGPDRQPEIFWAAAGGLGLTGVVLTAQIRLIPIGSSWLHTQDSVCTDLDDVLTTVRARERSAEHVVAWLDGHARGARTGRGVVSAAVHLDADDLPPRLRGQALVYQRARRPARCPSGPCLVRPGLVRTANAIRMAAVRRGPTARIAPLQHVLHPLDVALDWPALYGRRGLVQHQFSVPDGREDVLATVLDALTGAGCAPSLAVLKHLGAATPGPLSFPSPGWTLALDLPTAAAADASSLLDRLDELIAAAGGRVSLVKDSRLRRELVPRMYPDLAGWRATRRLLDPAGVLTSDLDRRLDLRGDGGEDRPC